MPTQKTYDWDVIRLEYMAGYQLIDPATGMKKHTYPTHQELVDKYGMSLKYLQQKSSEEKWSESRKYFQAKFREKATSDQIKAYISDSAQFDALTVDKAKKIYQMVDLYLAQYADLLPSEDNLADSNQSALEDSLLTLKTKDLLDLVNILDKSQALIRRTLGEPITNDGQFKELVDDINQTAKDMAGPSDNIDEEIEMLIKRKESFNKARESIKNEIEKIRESVKSD